MVTFMFHFLTSDLITTLTYVFMDNFSTFFNEFEKVQLA